VKRDSYMPDLVCILNALSKVHRTESGMRTIQGHDTLPLKVQ
jgi:hypothetical protein